MGTFAKYLCKEFFKLLTLCQAFFVFLYLVIDFTQKIDNFLETQASNTTVILFFVYKTPLIIIQMVPAATLISVVIMFSLMKKNNEITALKGSGISVFKMSVPVLIASMALSILVFLFSESVVPYASRKSNDLWIKEGKRHGQKRFYNRSKIWFKGKKGIYWIRHYDGKLKTMEDPVFYFVDDAFQLIRRVDAKKVFWTGTGWKADQGIVLQTEPDGGYKFEAFSKMDIPLPEDPETFLSTEKRPEEMSFWELKRYAEKSAMEGFDETRYLVDLNVKPAFSLLSFVMALIGIPIALGMKRGGAPMAVSLGIAACFLYVLIHGISQSLGYAGVLPPVFSAWLASSVFLLLGIYLMMRVET